MEVRICFNLAIYYSGVFRDGFISEEKKVVLNGILIIRLLVRISVSIRESMFCLFRKNGIQSGFDSGLGKLG